MKKTMYICMSLLIFVVIASTNVQSNSDATWTPPTYKVPVFNQLYRWIGTFTGGYAHGMSVYSFRPAYLARLNFNTGEYNIITKANIPKFCGFPETFDFPNMKAYEGCNCDFGRFSGCTPSYTVIDLNTGKVAGTFTLDVPAGTDMNAFQPEMFVSPDGAVIYVSYTDDGPYIDVFNGVMYTHITTTTEYNLSDGASFSKDSKYLYTNSIDATKLVKVDAYTGAVIKRTAPLNTIIHSNVVRAKLFHDSHAVLAILGYKDVYVYVYDIDTGGLSPSMPAGYPYTYNLSSDDTYLAIEPYEWVKDHTGGGVEKNYPGIVNVYNVATGQKVAGMNISLPTYPVAGGLGGYNIDGKAVTSYSIGAIISWANDHTFIYNTTQQLIYFDIKQNKIIKQIPIIRPWEQKGWMPEVK